MSDRWELELEHLGYPAKATKTYRAGSMIGRQPAPAPRQRSSGYRVDQGDDVTSGELRELLAKLRRVA